MPRAILAAFVALVLAFLGWWLLRPERLSDEEGNVLMAWLTCDECTDGELESVTDSLGARAIPGLRDALVADATPFVADARVAIARTWTRDPIPGGDSALFVDYFVANYEALARKRAAAALGALGDTAFLREAAEDALRSGFRSDVLVAIAQARRDAGAPGLPRLAAARVALRPAVVITLQAGDSAPVEALAWAADSVPVPGPFAWGSADPSVASVSSVGATSGVVAGNAAGTTVVTATLDGVSDSTTVLVAPRLDGWVMTMDSGNFQVVQAGEVVSTPLAVRVTVQGAALAGIGVTWTVQGGGADTARTVVPTDANGISRFRPALGPAPGPVWVQAQAGPSAVTRFQLRARR